MNAKAERSVPEMPEKRVSHAPLLNIASRNRRRQINPLNEQNTTAVYMLILRRPQICEYLDLGDNAPRGRDKWTEKKTEFA